VLVGFAGIALLLDPQGGATGWGIALVGGSAVAWAVGSYLSARLPLPRDVLVATSYEMLAGGLLLLPFGLAEQPDPASFSRDSALAFLYLVTFGSLIGFTAYIWLLAHVPLGTVSTYAYVNPVVAIALGVVFLDEVVTWRIAVGALVVLASVAVVVRRESDAALEPFAE
jgi:drug/metabolite transporter (DMT)-like permease